MLVKRISVIVCFLFFVNQLYSQGFIKVDGKTIVKEDGNEIILKGMGLGGWMLQEPYMLQLSGMAINQSSIRSKIVNLVGEDKTAVFYLLQPGLQF